MTDLSGAKGSQVGDRNVQLNVFQGTERERLRRYGTPPRLADSFQPRTELRAAVAAGLASGGAVLSQVVAAGNGGVGKTQLAAAVFHETTADLAAWITATARTPIVTGYAGAAAEIEPAWTHLAPDEAAERFLAWLRGTEQPWLVVLDDVADPDDLRGLWPQGPAGAVLVTTRRRDLRTGRRVDVDVFTPDESLAYLTGRLTTDDQRTDVLDGAAELAEDLGHLPVALSQAAAVVDFDGITCADYRAQHDLAALRPTDDYAHPVARTWQPAIERADAMEPAGLASEALALAAVLDPNGIPQEVRTGQGDDMRRALRNLHALHLVTHDPTGGPTSVRIHALVQRAVLHDMTDVAEVVRQAADRLVAIWPEVENDPPLSRSLRANTEVLATQPGLWEPDAHVTLFRAGISLGHAGLAAEAVAHFDALARRATDVLGPDHPDTLGARYVAEAWRGESGDLNGAVDGLRRLLPEVVRALGADDPVALSTRFHLARWRGVAGDPRGAADAYRALLGNQLRVQGPDHPETLSTRHDLAHWRGVAGDPDGAVQELRQVLADERRIRGPDHPDTLAIRHSLAHWRWEAGDLDGAVRETRQVLDDRVRVLGPDHPDTLTTRHNLACLLGDAGDPAAAVEALVPLLDDRVRVLGPDHPHTLITRHSLAVCRRHAGDHAAAEAELEAVLADRVRVLGEGHPDTADGRRLLEAWRRAGS